MNEKEARVWKSGIPYGPTVEKLKEMYPKPEEGLIIGHDELEMITNEKRGTERYYGVCNSWRKYLMNTLGIDTTWLSGIGIKILPPADRLHISERDMRHGMKKTGHGARRLQQVPVDRLDKIGQERWTHAMHVRDVLIRAMDDAKKQLATDLAPVKSLPKPSIPVQKSKTGE